ncbi:MAG: Sugar isomerase [Anaerolinea thermophila]|uniref:Sugar isomerase n=1 Tax=Anaerolinea thermophila TaxID=167964 RepID=A0A101FYS6_9CHLR|nr:MAG: Sugar isomerase [Anaerolinea thermophila]
MDQLFQEITQQPAAATVLIQQEFSHIREIIQKIDKDFNYILIAARGSSDNAGRYAQYLFGCNNRFSVALTTPSLFTLYATPPMLKGALVLSISQSGMSPDIIKIVNNANSQGCTTICITNNVESPLSVESKFTIPIHAGEEKAVAATKSYTNSLITLAMLSAAFYGKSEFDDQILQIPEWLQSTITSTQENLAKIQRYRYIESCAVLARGLNYCTAFEIALKIKELTGINANPYSSADFRHGPIATVYKGFPVFAIAPHGQVFSDMRQMVQDLLQRKAEVISVSNDENVLQESNLGFQIPTAIPEPLSPIVSTIPGQFFGWQIAIERGLNPDKPEGLNKVTETF